MNIAIDGPAGAGKSTIARRLAKEMGYVYVDTGAMYRAMALHIRKEKADALSEAEVLEAGKSADISIRYQDGEQQVILNGENVNGQIRTEEIGKLTSAISVYPGIRDKLVSLQQKLAKQADVIMDGRDIGTCVLPEAEVKIYLTASSFVRAKRRYAELEAKGEGKSLAKVQKDIEDRDYQDMHRKVSPLRQADDAVLLDSSDLAIEEVVEKIQNICRERQ